MNIHWKKLHPKHLNWLIPLCLSGIMSGAISCFNMIINKGFVEGFFMLWLHAWSLSWLMAFPLVLMVLPIVRRLLMRYVVSTNA